MYGNLHWQAPPSEFSPALQAPASDVARLEDAKRFLDRMTASFVAGHDPETSTLKTVEGLARIQAEMTQAEWSTFIPLAQAHPIAGILHQDPMTDWSFRKPRGYSGDAGLLDFIYQHPSVAEELRNCCEIGRQIHAYTQNAPAPVAVRERKNILRRLVDRVAAERGHPIRVLAIAAGHLREADESEALARGAVEQWIALDQDKTSLAEISRRFPSGPVQTIAGSVRGILAGKYDLGTFDLVYAAGLYDYLVPKVADRLTARAFEMLRPEGTYLFANFAEGIADRGYMETFMDWRLIFRSRRDIENIVARMSMQEPKRWAVYAGLNEVIIYCEIEKMHFDEWD